MVGSSHAAIGAGGVTAPTCRAAHSGAGAASAPSRMTRTNHEPEPSTEAGCDLATADDQREEHLVKTQPSDPPPRAARPGAASGVEDLGRAQRQGREHGRPLRIDHICSAISRLRRHPSLSAISFSRPAPRVIPPGGPLLRMCPPIRASGARASAVVLGKGAGLRWPRARSTPEP